MIRKIKVKGRIKHVSRCYKFFEKYFFRDYWGVGLGYGMVDTFGDSKKQVRNQYKWKKIGPKSSSFEYTKLGNRINIKLFNLYVKKHLTSWLKNTKKVKYFTFHMNELQIKKRVKKVAKFFFRSRIIIAFFVNKSIKQFKKLSRRAKKIRGPYTRNYIWLLEGRLVSVSYRLYFFNDLYDSLQSSKLSFLWLGSLKKYIYSCYFIIPCNDFVSFSPLIKGTIFWTLVRKLGRRAIYGAIPKFIGFSMKFFKFIVKWLPKLDYLIYPFVFDIFRVCGKKY